MGNDANGYRNAVRTSIYSEFSPEDYQSLIDGLLTVRKQSITDGLTPARLNQLLTDGLPGLDPHELDHVARGFEHLDARRDTIENLAEAVAASQAVARRARTYSRSALRYVADHVTTATSNLDGITRRRGAAQDAHGTATSALVASESALEGVTATLGTLDVREQAIRESAGYASISQLDEQRRTAESTESEADRAAAAHQDASTSTQPLSRTQPKRRGKLTSPTPSLPTALRELAVAGRELDVAVEGDPDPSVTAQRYRDEIALREIAVAEVRKLISARDEAGHERDRANEAADLAAETLQARIVIGTPQVGPAARRGPR